MVQPFVRYRDAMRTAWGDWWLAWPLLQQVAVGDVLQQDSGGAVRPAGTLTGRRIPYEETTPRARGEFVFDAGGAVDVRFKASGTTDPLFSALAEAEAGALLRFGRENGVFVAYRGLTETGTPDARALAASLVSRYWQGSWDPELLAVTQVVRADTAAVLVATGAEAAVELRLATSLGAGPLQLADLAGGAEVARSRHLGFQWIGEHATPLFRVVRLRPKWLGGVRAEFGPAQPGRGLDGEPVPEVLLEEALADPSAVLETPPQPAGPEDAS
ncbi:hypothetical protein ACIQPR_13665 [Streptomyces sp. NPDC091280]|uniref:hypothetical protein n=1 Tax=Streptomyces sp. NPDC091280 TaxID=3365984 RepID=UPI00381852D5